MPNFFLAGSYTFQDYIDSMEGATKSGKKIELTQLPDQQLSALTYPDTFTSPLITSSSTTPGMLCADAILARTDMLQKVPQHYLSISVYPNNSATPNTILACALTLWHSDTAMLCFVILPLQYKTTPSSSGASSSIKAKEEVMA